MTGPTQPYDDSYPEHALETSSLPECAAHVVEVSREHADLFRLSLRVQNKGELHEDPSQDQSHGREGEFCSAKNPGVGVSMRPGELDIYIYA